MTDPAERSQLYQEAERNVQELLNRGVISHQGYQEIFRILHSERDVAQKSDFQAPQQDYPPPQQGYQQALQQSYPPPQQGYQQSYYSQPVQGVPVPYNPNYPQPQGYMAPATQQSMPPPQESMPPPKQEVAQPEHPPPEAQHSSSGLGKFGKRMGNNVVNSMTHGFGFTIGSEAAHSLWHKF